MNANNATKDTKDTRLGPLLLWSAAAIFSAVLALPANAQVPPPGAPGKPGIRQATGMDGRISVPFSPPTNTGASPITGYVATCGDKKSPATLDSGIPGVLIVRDVTNGRPYTCTVVAINARGTGPASDVSNSVTPVGVPGAPIIGAATVVGNEEVRVAFTPPGNDGGRPILSYTATCGNAGATSTNVASPSPLVVRGPLSNAPFTCRVMARNLAGDGPFSAASNSVTAPPASAGGSGGSPSTSPGAPGKPGIRQATGMDGRITVPFSPPTNTGSSPITGYVATCGDKKSPATLDSGIPGVLIVTGVTNGQAYTCTVVAINAQGTGPASDVSNSVTPVGVPGAPIIGAATVVGNEEVRVAFTPPGNDGGRPILSYTATCGNAGATSTNVASPSPLVVRGPVSNAPFTCRVMARNLAGDGPFSAASNSLAAPPASAGGSGGSPFTSDCNSDGVMVGIKVRTGSLVDSIQAVCVKVNSNGTWAGSQFDGTRAGGNGGAPGSLICANGSAVRGIFGKAGSLIDNIGLACVTMTGSNGIVTTVGSPQSMGPLGGAGGSAFSQGCDGGRLAKGISGSAGTLIDKISVNCHNPTATR